MTLATALSRTDYTSNGSATIYPYTFRILAASDLRVITRSVTTGLETVLAYPANYTVSGVGNTAGGSITLATPITAGDVLTIRRVRPGTQQTSFRSQGSFFPETHEDAFDHVVMLADQLQDQLDRSLKLQETLDPSLFGLTLPTPTAGLVLTGTGSGFTMAAITTAAAVTLPGAGRTVSTLSAYLLNNAVFNVKDFGAVADGSAGGGTNNAVAFNAASAAALVAGGMVVVPPGPYYKNAQWLLTYTGTVIVTILGFGAEIFDGPAVTGSSIKVLGAPQPHGVTIMGLKGNHRNNTTAAAFIELNGSSHGHLADLWLEVHNTKAGYAFILLAPTTPGTDSTNSFWTRIERLHMRQRTGGDGTQAAYGILLKGQANATSIRDCSFSHVNSAIALVTDGVGNSLATSVVIDGNAFEGGPILKAIDVVAFPTTGYWPTGLRVCNNRVESTTTFLSMTTGGAAANNHSHPPFLYGNYVVNGSVTNYIVNPLNAYISCMDPQYQGAAVAPFRLQTMDHVRFVMPTGKNLILANESGQSSYASAHLQLGEDAVSSVHLWFNTGNGDLYYKFGSAPTTATDGQMIGSVAGLLSTRGLIITTSAAKLIPGATSFSVRKSDDSVDNLTVLESGDVTSRATMTATAFRVGVNQVVGARQAAITTPNAQTAAYVQADVTSLKTAIDAIRTVLITHGLTS